MNRDLERLIDLQRLDDETARAKAKIESLPSELAELHARLAEREAALATARARLDDNQRARREIEKDLAAVETRLARYKDQLMAVKTNKEYQAMQHEIATAERDVRAMEDRILDGMEEAEELAAVVKAADTALAAEQSAVGEQERQMAELRTRLETQIAKATSAREAIVADLGADALALFEHVARTRRGVAVAEARDGHCTECHVRLRPQRDNEIRRNDRLIQCESCLRILYYAGPVTGAAEAEA